MITREGKRKRIFYTGQASGRKILLLIWMFLFIVFADIQLAAQQAAKEEAEGKYKLEENIFYYPPGQSITDKYITERCRLDIYYPADKKDFITVVWFHGGGIKNGNKSIPGQLKNKGIAVVAVNYRLSPQVKNPAYLKDAAAAVAWTFKNIENYGGNASKIIVSGHSAGGYLTSMTGLDKSLLAEHDIDANEIALLVPFSGHTITHFTIREERGIADTRAIVDEYAPLYHVRSDAPPLVLITGDRELELLGRYEENAYLWRMMQVAGHKNTRIYELDGFNHGGMASPAFEILLNEIKNMDNL